jgi:hypothetical protein
LRYHIEVSDADAEAMVKKTLLEHHMTERDLVGVDREAILDYNRGVARNEKVFELLENQP